MLSDKGEEYLRAMLDDLADPTRRLGGGETRAERKARIAAHKQLRQGLSLQEQGEVLRAVAQHRDRLRQDRKAARHGVRLRALGIIVKDGEVRTPTRRLGDLAGAEAQVTDGARVARVGAAAAATPSLARRGCLPHSARKAGCTPS